MDTAPDGSPLIAALNGTIVALETCTIDTCSLLYAQVQYQPSRTANLAYLIIFAVVLLAQFVLGLVYRTWGFMVGMSFGLVLEVVGYAGRLGLHNNPFDFNSFLMYLVCLTIGPAFLSASIYLSLARLVVVHGAHSARFAPRTYTITFICCDIISLILQAAGGALAASGNDMNMKNTGVNIMIAGLAFQVVSLALFMVLSVDFWLKVRRAGGEGGSISELDRVKNRPLFRIFPLALALATITIFIRCVYRVAELQGGFAGKLANDEVVFMVFEGPMIMAAVIALTIFHPGPAFAGAWKAAKPISSGRRSRRRAEKSGGSLLG